MNKNQDIALKVVADAMTCKKVEPADLAYILYEQAPRGLYIMDWDGYFGSIEGHFTYQELTEDYDIAAPDLIAALEEMGACEKGQNL